MVAEGLTSTEQKRQNNMRLRLQAHERLDALMDAAEREQLYGKVSVEATYYDGEISLISHGKSGTDK